MTSMQFSIATLVSFGFSLLCCYLEARRYGFSKDEWLKYAHLIIPSWFGAVLVPAGEHLWVTPLCLLWMMEILVLGWQSSPRPITRYTLATMVIAPITLFFVFRG